MKKLLLFAIPLFIAGGAIAKIWRCNNIPGITADFTTIQAAHDHASVQPGDTIHLEPSTTNYGALNNMTKRLTIISIGDFLSANPGAQYSPIAGTMTSFSASNVGASGSVFHCNFSSSVTVSNTTSMRFERCHIEGAMSFNQAHNNTILQSYIYAFTMSNSNNNVISNNIVTYYFDINASASATITNNVFFAETAITNRPIHNSTFQNNILNKLGAFVFTNTNVNNNLAANTSLPAGNGNVNSVNMTTVFVNPSGTNDAAFKLQTAGPNPATGAGIAGVDCGAYGGASPFKPGLQAAIPAIYKLLAPATPSGSTMNITFSTRSNN